MQGGENWITRLDHQANVEKLQDILWIFTVMGSILMIDLKVTLSKATFLLFQIIYRSVSWKCHTPQKISTFLPLKSIDVIVFGKGLCKCDDD